jgi:branched-chain amino acid transport system permease protein
MLEILPQLILNAIISGSVYALTSSGLALTYGLLKILNFSHGHIMMVGAYLFYFFSQDLSFSTASAGSLTVIAVIFLALILLKIFVLPFLAYSLLLTFVTTLALATILESTISMIFGVNVKSLSTNFEVGSYEFWGTYVTPIQLIIIGSAVVVLLLLAVIIHLTPFGRFIRGFSENSYAAESLGINKIFLIRFVYILGSVLAAFAGILVAYETNMQPTMGSIYTIKAFAAMILGGLGNLWGTIAGSYLLGFIENLSIGIDFWGYSLPAGYKDAFAFFIILLVLLVKPKGLFNRKSRST